MALFLAGGACAEALAPRPSRQASLIEVEGLLGPVMGQFMIRGIHDAQARGHDLVVLRLDTPGGLDTTMRSVIKEILASSVPVVTYVAPAGARAASAGTYIAYASHVAAMAPATNLGAATPVQLMAPGAPGRGSTMPPAREAVAPDDPLEGPGPPVDESAGGSLAPKAGDAMRPGVGAEDPSGALERKMVNDAVAYIQGLARLRGRNAEWAAEAVRGGVSLTAEDALEAGVIDLMAPDLGALLVALNGRTVEVHGAAVVLRTEGMSLETIEPGWLTVFFATITHPNVAYLLMLLGIYGIYFELSNPGGVLPGALGSVGLLLALYAFQVLPVNFAGLGVILLGLALMVAEAFVPSFGALGVGGAVAFVFGSLILIETDVDAYKISPSLIGTMALGSLAFLLGIVTLVLKRRRGAPVSGVAAMVGQAAEAVEPFDSEGRVRACGELWNSLSATPVERGDRLKILAVRGLILDVEPWTMKG